MTMNMGWKPLSDKQKRDVARRRDKALGLSEKRRAKQKYQKAYGKKMKKVLKKNPRWPATSRTTRKSKGFPF